MKKISVIICTYNRCDSLKDTLESFLAQKITDDLDYEIVVVDNNSKDATKDIIVKYIPKFNSKLRYVLESKHGLSNARNKGIVESTGSILAFIDDDVILDNRWILNLHNCFIKYNCDAIGGMVMPLYPKNTPKWIIENSDILKGAIANYDYGEDIMLYEKNRMSLFLGGNMAFRRDCFNEFGVFRPDLGLGKGTTGEDSEFLERLTLGGKKLYYCGIVKVFHKVDKKKLNYIYLAKRNLQTGKYLARLQKNDENLIYFFGVPRYIFKEILRDLFTLFVIFFNKKIFLKSWSNFFINIGKISEYI